MFSAFSKALVLCFILSSYALNVNATIWYVKPSATGLANGSAWNNASADLQAVLNASASGDEVWVASGIFFPTHDPLGNLNPADARDRTFRVKEGIKLYGGFAGNETTVAARNLTLNTTTLSGDLGVTGDASDNAYHVIISFSNSGGALPATIDGFTVTGGRANVGTSFVLNGGYYFLNAGRGYGAGIYITGGPGIVLQNLKIWDNQATSFGGGIYAWNTLVQLKNDSVAANWAPDGGGCYINGSMTADSCVFNSNTANTGGGIALIGGSLTFTNSSVYSNAAINGVGGGLYLSAVNCILTGNSIYSNTANGYWGGGLFYTGGNFGTLTAVNNCLFNNSAQKGGAIYNNDGVGNYSNNTFFGNLANSDGGAIAKLGGNINLKNNIFWGNKKSNNANLGGADIAILGSVNNSFYNNAFQLASGAYTFNSNAGANVFATNPYFVNANLPAGADGRHRTPDDGLALSPCTGLADLGMTLIPAAPTDIAGQGRVGAYDLGAYELQTAMLNPVTVGAITGDSVLCLGTTDTLFNAVAGGVWSSSNSAVVTVSATGIISGVAAGNAVVSYTHGTTGCPGSTANKIVVVAAANSLGPITGPDSACTLSTVQMSNATPYGLWVVTPAIAYVNSAGLVNTGTNTGVTTILYKHGIAACSSTVSKTLVVGQTPTVASVWPGNPNVCPGGATQYTCATPGGIWSTVSNGLIASISGNGIATGISSGRDTVKYTVTNSFGCSRSEQYQVNVIAPPVVTTNISSRDTICVGDTTSLFLSYPNPSRVGNYTSVNPAIATVTNSGSGNSILTGVMAGTAVVSVNVSGSSGCSTTKTKTIVVLPPPAVAAILGSASLCVGSTLQLTNATAGGVWTSTSAGSRSLVSSTGLLTAIAAGTDTVRYTVSNSLGCTAVATKIITLLAPVLAPISGPDTLCTGTATSLSHATAGGTWSHFNSLPGTVSSSGIYAATASGTDTVFYQYTSANGCGATVKKPLTVLTSPAPTSITGSDSLCAGQQTLFTSAPAGGVWTTLDATVATVNSTTGVVTGINQGLATLTYTITHAGVCSASVSKTIFVKALPVVATISGPAVLCLNTAQQYTNVTAGGTWSSGTAGAVSASGLYVAATAGPDTIRYAVTNSFGCMGVAQLPLAVSAPQSAPVLGADSMCKGSTALFSHVVTGGTWTNHNAGLGLVNAAGLYTAGMPGLDTLYYSYTSNGCAATAKKVLRILVGDSAVITGTTALCKGASQLLIPSVTGGTWISSDNTVANVTAGGQVSGMSGGTAVIRYTVTGTLGCTATSAHPVTVTAPVTTTAQTGLVLTATGNQTGATYQWIDCGSNLPLAGATDPVYAAPAAGGRFAVVVSYQGCSDTSVCLTLAPAGVAAFAGRNNNVIVSYISGSQLLINTGDRLPRSCRLLDMQGKLVQEFVPKEFQTLLDVTDVAKGIYILYLNFSNEKVVRKVNIW